MTNVWTATPLSRDKTNKNIPVQGRQKKSRKSTPNPVTTLAVHTRIMLQISAGDTTRLVARTYVGHVHLQMSNVYERPRGDSGEMNTAT